MSRSTWRSLRICSRNLESKCFDLLARLALSRQQPSSPGPSWPAPSRPPRPSSPGPWPVPPSSAADFGAALAGLGRPSTSTSPQSSPAAFSATGLLGGRLLRRRLLLAGRRGLAGTCHVVLLRTGEPRAYVGRPDGPGKGCRGRTQTLGAAVSRRGPTHDADACERRTPRVGSVPRRRRPALVPGAGAGDHRALARPRGPSRPASTSASGADEFVFYDGPPVRQRPPPLRAPPHRLREGRRPPLPDHAGPAGRAPLRLGLPRPAGRDGGREDASACRAGWPSRSSASTPSTRSAARSSAAPPTSWARLRQPPGPLGRHGQRLQDHGPLVHGVGHVGVQDSSTTRACSTRASGCSPTAGSARRRCPTSRPAWTTPTASARTRRVTVWFELRARGERLLVWTTTPWTLPSNLALAVGPDIDLRRVPRTPTAPQYVLGEATVEKYAKELEGVEQVGTVTGAELVGRRYTPMFDFFAGTDERLPGARRRLGRHRRGHRHRCTSRPASARTTRPLCDAARHPHHRARSTSSGRFTAEVPDYAGMQVFDANADDHPGPQGPGRRRPPRHLRPRLPALLAHRHAAHLQGRVVAGSCRSPPSRTGCSSSTSRSTGCPSTSATAPSASGSRAPATGRSAATGSGARPSRCGSPTTPPTRASTSTAASTSSSATSACGPTDLHRPTIDELTRPNPDDPTGQSTMRRIPDVLDCWFESGSMPFAQVHYPFENRDWFETPLPRRLHRRVHRPDPRLVLHAARAVHGAVRPAGVPDLRGPRRAARRRRPEAVQAAAQLPRPGRGVRHHRLRRHALVAAVVRRRAGRRHGRRPAVRWRRPSARSCCRSGTPGTSSRSTPTPATLRRADATRRRGSASRPRARPLRPGQGPPAGRGASPTRMDAYDLSGACGRDRSPSSTRSTTGTSAAPATASGAATRRPSTRSTPCSTSLCRVAAPLLPLLTEHDLAGDLTGERLGAPGRLARRRRRCPTTPALVAQMDPVREVCSAASSVRKARGLRRPPAAAHPHRRPWPVAATDNAPSRRSATSSPTRSTSRRSCSPTRHARRRALRGRPARSSAAASARTRRLSSRP